MTQYQEKLLRFLFPIKRINSEEKKKKKKRRKKKETKFPPKQKKEKKKKKEEKELSILFFRTIPPTYDVTTPANGVHCGARS